MTNYSQIKTIIVEDSFKAQEFLKSTLKENYPSIQVMGVTVSITESIRLIQEIQPELVFMDIELNDGLSFEIFDSIKKPTFEVIFITGFDYYHQKALDHFALSYITKPIDVIKLKKTIDHYIQLKERLFSIEKLKLAQGFIIDKNPKIFIQTINEHLLVKTKEIILIEADGNYTNFHMYDDSKHLASKNLKYYENFLPKNSFFRASRFAVINIDFIDRIHKKETIILTTGHKIHVSTRNKSKLLDFIKNLS